MYADNTLTAYAISGRVVVMAYIRLPTPLLYGTDFIACSSSIVVGDMSLLSITLLSHGVDTGLHSLMLNLSNTSLMYRDCSKYIRRFARSRCTAIPNI